MLKMEKTQEKPILRVLGELEAGASHTFPIERMNSVKSMCSSFGLQWGKTFKTSINRAERTLVVTRTE